VTATAATASRSAVAKRIIQLFITANRAASVTGVVTDSRTVSQ
jgi:hypothetical protein